MLLALNLNFCICSCFLDDILGQIFSIFILTVAAAESSIGLAFLILYYRMNGTILLSKISILNGGIIENIILRLKNF